MTVRYPWPTFASPLQCRLNDIRLDGQLLPPQLMDDDQLRLRLDSAGDWQQFDCDVTVTTDEKAPAGVGHLLDYVVVSSARANTRMPFRLERSSEAATGHLTVPRGVLADSFTLQAETGALLADRHRVIGSSDSWTVVLNRREAPVPPGKPPFDIAWIDFTDETAPPVARENPNAHALIDLNNEPRLLLNQSIDGLQALMHNNTAKLERRRLRDILGSSVARYATAALFRAAAAEVISYDNLPQPPSSAMLRQTCGAVADQMPGISGVEELYEQLVSAADSPLATTELWTRIDLAIDELTGFAGALTTAAGEIANG